MAINKKLIHFKNKQKFEEELAKGNILNTSIVFILDTTEIYTHGLLYDGSTFDPSNIEASILNIIDTKLTKTEAASTYLSKTEASATYLGKTAKAVDATKADSATKATQDASGNVITSTYATKTSVNNIQTQIDTLVSGDANTAIESFNEIIAFLEGVEDTETLDGIIAGINTEIAKKADKSNAVTNITRNGTTFTATRADGTTFTFNLQDNNTTYSAGTGLALSGTTFNHSNSVTAKTAYGSTATTASANGGKITVTDIKYDAQGHITGSTDRTITLSQDHTKTNVTAGTAGTSTATSGASIDIPYVTVNANGHVTGYGTHKHTISGFLTSETYKGTVTSVATGVGLTGGTITSTGTLKTKLRNETPLTVDATVRTEDANKVYPVGIDKSGYLAVNVPWTTYTAASTTAAGLMSAGDKTKLDGIETGALKNTITGVKGNSESSYRTGNVNITKSNIGLGNVDNTADASKSVNYATSSGTATTATNLASAPTLAASGNNITVTAGGKTSAAFTVPYATSSGSATKATQDGNGNVITETYATKTEVSNTESIANEANEKAVSAETSSEEALNIANEAKTVANIAKNAVATLEGLANTTTAQETLAAQVVQIEENKQNVEYLSNSLSILNGGTYHKNLTLDDIGVRRSGYYINKNDGKQYSSSLAVITNAVFLNVGDSIHLYTGGSGLAAIAKSEDVPDNSTVFTVIAKADNLISPIDYEVIEAGYYSFSGRNAEQGDSALVLNIKKQEEIKGIVPEMEYKVTALYDGTLVEIEYSVEDLSGDGAMIDRYLHYDKMYTIASTDTIVTAPVYLYAGDKVRCSTGGTGFCVFAESSTGIIVPPTTFKAIADSSAFFDGYVEKDGWYVFSGRTNRTDGTNLDVYIKSSKREKNVYDLLNEKASKSEVAEIAAKSSGGNGFALSIGADSVKDPIPPTPWFNNVDNDGTTYGTYLDDKIDSVPQGDSFIFISDVHYPGNKKNSAKLIDYVRRRLGIKTIIHGGDVINESSVMADAAKEWLDFNRDFVFRIGGDFKQACGDHDHNGRYADSGQAFSYQFVQRVMNGYNIKELNVDTIYDEQVEERAGREGWTDFERKEYDAWKKMHYYFDDSTINTRFIVLHTGWTGDVGLAVDKLGSDVLSEASALHLQMDFLYDALNSCPKGMNVVVVGHNTIGNKEYKVNIDGGSASRYNVNEPVWKGLWQNVAKMIRAFKNKESVILNYRDWSGEGLKSKTFDYSGSQTPELIFCMGGDVHWDIMCKSTSDSENLSVVELATSLDNIIPTDGRISKSDILHALTMTDGGDRGYRGIIAPPSSNYNDNTDSVLVSSSNTEGTLDSQAFDIVTICKDTIYFTRIGSGKDRIVRITD